MKSAIEPYPTLSGTITKSVPTVHGTISAREKLSGSISQVHSFEGQISAFNLDLYEGEYSVKPLPFQSQTLTTKDKTLKEDVTVGEIPYYQVRNQADGTTVCIGD